MRIPERSIAWWVSRPFVSLIQSRGQRVHDVTRAYWIRRIVAVAAVLVALVFLGWLSYTFWPEEVADPDREAPTEVAAIVLMIAFGGWLFIDRRNRRQRVADIASTGSRPPVLYLRSFEHDGEIVKFAPWWFSPATWGVLSRPRQLLSHVRNVHRFTFESLLRRACRGIGPVVGIGEPGEIIPSSGMRTEYVGEDWERRVSELLKQAQLVVVRAARTPGLMAELSLVASIVEPTKVLLFVGGDDVRRGPYASFFGTRSNNSERRESFYSSFRFEVRSLWPVPLPQTIGDHKFLRFDEDWAPHPVSRTKRSPQPSPAEEVGLWLNLATSGRPG